MSIGGLVIRKLFTMNKNCEYIPCQTCDILKHQVKWLHVKKSVKTPCLLHQNEPKHLHPMPIQHLPIHNFTWIQPTTRYVSCWRIIASKTTKIKESDMGILKWNSWHRQWNCQHPHYKTYWRWEERIRYQNEKLRLIWETGR